MIWSFSRLNLYYACPYSWLLQYIEEEESDDNFYAQYGSFMHKTLEKYYSDELQMFELSGYYEEYYDDFVTEEDIYSKSNNLKERYKEIGIDYLDNLKPLPAGYKIVAVEKKVEFEIDGYKFKILDKIKSKSR